MLNYQYHINKTKNGYHFTIKRYDYFYITTDLDGNVIDKSHLFDSSRVDIDKVEEDAKKLVKTFQDAPYEDCFIRFNDLPKSGKSTNWNTGEEESGISAFRAKWDMANGTYFAYGALEGAEIVYLFQKAPIYLVTGDVVGVGADGEPTLSNVKVISKLKRIKAGYILEK